MSKYKDVFSKPDTKPTKLQEPFQEKRQLLSTQPEKLPPTNDAQTAISHPPLSPKLKSHIKRAMLIYSRIHYKLNLRFQTLFRAIAIYKAYKGASADQRSEAPEEYILAACMYMTMKYEEIYPAEFRKVTGLIKPNWCLDRQLYFKTEVSVLLTLGGNLDIPTPYTIIDSKFLNQDKATYLYAYFLLEIGLINQHLAAMEFSDLCNGVVRVMTAFGDFLKQRSSETSEQQAQQCAKTIIKARYAAVEQESVIYKKYTQECYLGVSEKTFFMAHM